MTHKLHALYFNGLGTGQTRWFERFVIRYLGKRGIAVEHVSINWYAHESLAALLTRTTKLVEERLEAHGQVLLIGSSAGGSLAVNLLGQVKNDNLKAVTLCSRLRVVKLPFWDGRSLTRMAGLNHGRPSRLFFDAVTYCTSITVPELTSAEKSRITIIKQLADDMVPRRTMYIPGVRVRMVPIIGHGLGILLGALRLPKILDKS